jgi:hypothetical protein
MKRFVLMLSLLGLAYAGTPPPAAAQASKCEAFCIGLTAGCYAFVAPWTGPEKCDSFYEGCIDGCTAAVSEEVES